MGIAENIGLLSGVWVIHECRFGIDTVTRAFHGSAVLFSPDGYLEGQGKGGGVNSRRQDDASHLTG